MFGGGGGFGSTPSTFGSTGFGAAANTGASVFGQPAQPQQQPTSLFGGGGSAFGSQQTGLPAFGSGTATVAPTFGAQNQGSSVFGQQVRPTTGIFSSAGSGISPFSTQTQVAGTSIQFNAITGTDTMMKNGAASQINTRHQCITCMKEYENKSLEELRLEDYQLNRKGPQAPMFGGATQAPQTQTSLFSGIGGAPAGATSTGTFGQSTAFGQTAPQGGGLFGSLNQPKTGGFFGSSTPSTSTAFGGGTGLGFSFSNPTSQPQASIFGTNNNAPTSTTGLGASNAFSFSTQPQPQQQQQGLSLFGPKTLSTPASTAPTFGGGFGAAPANTAINKPLFGGATATPTFGGGSVAPTFGTGTGSLFSTNQQQQQQKPFSFSTPFSSSQPASQPTFGTTSTSSFSFSNPVSTPAISFGGAAQPTFGTPATGTTSTFGAPLSFPLSQNTQQTQPTSQPSTFSNFFSNTSNSGPTGTTGLSLFSNPAASSTFGGFGSNQLQLGQSQPFALQSQQQQQQQALQMHQMQQQTAPNAISFATTPFKDCQLFYNLISSRKVEDLSKPTNPLAQRQYREASRRKTSTSLSVPPPGGQSSQNNPGIITWSPIVKNLTFSTATKTNSITKFDIFDGFPEEDLGVRLDLLSPKSNVKKLILKSTDGQSAVAAGSQSAPHLNGSAYGLRRSSLLSGLNSSKASYMSPLSQQRRVRIAMSSSLENNHDSYNSVEGDRTLGSSDPLIRRLDFGETVLSDSHHSFVNEGRDECAGAEVFTSTAGNGSLSSRRDSEVELSGVLNGSGAFSEGSACGVICTRPGYYVKPSIEELDKLVDSTGACYVSGFELGRLNFGRIRYLQPVNVANVNIDETVLFRHKEVIVYPDDDNKPELGKGLNAPAEIELERVFPLERATNELIRSADKIKAQNYEQKLRKACERTGSEFIAYSEINGVWRFRVGHFSKYGCEEEEKEEEDKEAKKGLGGIAQKDLQQQQQQQRKNPQAGVAGAGDAPIGPIHARLAFPHYIPSPPAPIHHLDQLGAASTAPTSDVELNPLTPCDSDDDEDEDLEEDEEDEGILSLRLPVAEFPGRPEEEADEGLSVFRYRPYLKAYGAEKARLMKSVMSMEEQDEQNPSTHLTHAILVDSRQPPSKKSRPSTKLMPEQSEEGKPGQKLKERLSQSFVKKERRSSGVNAPPPIPTLVPREKIVFDEEADVEDLFASIAPKTFTSGIRPCGAPRVCFLPGGQFIKIVQGVGPEGFKAELKTEQMASYADKQQLAPSSKSIRRAIERQMEARLQGNKIFFQRHARILAEEIEGSEVSKVAGLLEEELVIWQLCDILWPARKLDKDESKDDGAHLEQRKRLSKWLERHARILFGSEYEESDKTTLGLLKKGKVEEASLTAIEQGNDWLAVLMCTDPHLLLDFADEMVVEGMGQDFPDIFALLSGNIAKLSFLNKEQVLKMSSWRWLQFFALYIWFEGVMSSPLPISVDQAVQNFEALMREVGGKEDLALPAKEISSVANLAMHLLKLYSFTGYPVGVVVRPRTGSKDCLDYKLSWLLMRDLEQIGYVPSEDCYKGVCLGFSDMLEGIGMWKWAPFVLNHLKGGKAYKLALDAVTQRLLERNLTGDVEEEVEDFLVNILQIPTNLIYSIRMWRNQSLRLERTDEKLFYLGEMGEWQGAYDLLRTFLKTKSSLDLIGTRVGEQAENMRVHLKRLEQRKDEIVGWELEGKMLQSYLALKDPQGTHDAVLTFLESVMKFKPANINQSAFVLDMTLSAQKVIQLLLAESGGSDVKRKIEDNLILFLETAKPDEYFEGLRSFINFGFAPNNQLCLMSFHNWEPEKRKKLNSSPQPMEIDVQTESHVIELSEEEEEMQPKKEVL